MSCQTQSKNWKNIGLDCSIACFECPLRSDPINSLACMLTPRSICLDSTFSVLDLDLERFPAPKSSACFDLGDTIFPMPRVREDHNLLDVDVLGANVGQGDDGVDGEPDFDESYVLPRNENAGA